MRGLRSTVALLVVLIGLGAYIYFATWKRPENADTGKKNEKVFTVQSDKIEEIKVALASGETTTVKKDGGAWKVTCLNTMPSRRARCCQVVIMRG